MKYFQFDLTFNYFKLYPEPEFHEGKLHNEMFREPQKINRGT
jgi:hypothetical protein